VQYRFETTKKDYSHFASGRVLYNAPGSAPFPVRLASEILYRAFEFLDPLPDSSGYKIYDPCCGSGYLLTVLGFLHAARIHEIAATDYDPNILEIARKNLSLLSPEGLERRKEEIKEYIKKYGKPSHVEALASVEYLKTLQKQEPIKITCKQRDITEPNDDSIQNCHIIIADLPYGNLVSWKGNKENPLEKLFENAYKSLALRNAVVVIAADKKQKPMHERFERVHHFKAGKRQVSFFKPLI